MIKQSIKDILSACPNNNALISVFLLFPTILFVLGAGHLLADEAPIRSVVNSTDEFSGFLNAFNLGLYDFNLGASNRQLMLRNLGTSHEPYPDPRQVIAKVTIGPLIFDPTGLSIRLEGSWQLGNSISKQPPNDALTLPGLDSPLQHPGMSQEIPVRHTFVINSTNANVTSMFNVSTMREEFDVEFSLRYGCRDTGQACSKCPPFGASNFVSPNPVAFQSISIIPEPSTSLLGVLCAPFAMWIRSAVTRLGCPTHA